MQDKYQAELASFGNIWHGGFYEGDPADPSFGLWGLTSFMGVSHSIYLGACKPYISSATVVLEIGCGRGAWTKLMLDARHVYCLDALSAEHNGFYEYVGRRPNVEYFKVEDFSMNQIPMDFIDFSFSYDALCHVSFDGISAYAASLYPRMRRNGHGIWMVADYEKYNAFVDNQSRYCVLNALLPRNRRRRPRRMLERLVNMATRWNTRRYGLRRMNDAGDATPRPGRWYHAGTERTCRMLQCAGFTILDRDMGFDFRSPIIHFQKP